jgi:hypothetical protein
MSTELFTVSDYLKWGQLVKSWAMGRAYPGLPGTKGPPLSPPTTLDDLKKQCADVGLAVKIPSYLTQIRVLPGAMDTLTIRLPAKELVESVEADFEKGTTYSLPDFYDDLYQMKLPPVPPNQQLDLQARRIGDYAVGMCQ